MLVQRLITALVLIPLVVAGVLYLPTPTLAMLLGILVLIGGLEWSRLAEIRGNPGRLLFVVAMGLLLWLLALALDSYPGFHLMLSAAASVWWGLAAATMAAGRSEWLRRAGKFTKVLLGLLILSAAWACLVALHGSGSDGPQLLLFLLVLIWVADSAAYFAGRRWGRVKLAPEISPGKTREGVYGALAGAALCGLFLAWHRPETGPLPVLVLFCMLIALISVSGDLFESLMKRQAGLKDSGQLLPGHGGMLDRIDSLTAAAPFYLAGLLLLERLS